MIDIPVTPFIVGDSVKQVVFQAGWGGDAFLNDLGNVPVAAPHAPVSWLQGAVLWIHPPDPQTAHRHPMSIRVMARQSLAPQFAATVNRNRPRGGFVRNWLPIIGDVLIPARSDRIVRRCALPTSDDRPATGENNPPNPRPPGGFEYVISPDDVCLKVLLEIFVQFCEGRQMNNDIDPLEGRLNRLEVNNVCLVAVDPGHLAPVQGAQVVSARELIAEDASDQTAHTGYEDACITHDDSGWIDSRRDKEELTRRGAGLQGTSQPPQGILQFVHFDM